MTILNGHSSPPQPIFDIQLAGGSSWTPGHSRHGLVAATWTGDVITVQVEPVRVADWDDVSTLLDRHVERLDDVYRRLG